MDDYKAEEQRTSDSEAEYLELAGKFNRLALRESMLKLRVEELEAELGKERKWGNQSFIAIVAGSALMIAALFLKSMGVL